MAVLQSTDYRLNRIGRVRTNVTMRCVRVTSDAVEKQYYIFRAPACSLSYAACKVHIPYYILICGLSGSIMFFHIVSAS
jgi:hypothetical protein